MVYQPVSSSDASISTNSYVSNPTQLITVVVLLLFPLRYNVKRIVPKLQETCGRNGGLRPVDRLTVAMSKTRRKKGAAAAETASAAPASANRPVTAPTAPNRAGISASSASAATAAPSIAIAPHHLAGVAAPAAAAATAPSHTATGVMISERMTTGPRRRRNGGRGGAADKGGDQDQDPGPRPSNATKGANGGGGGGVCSGGKARRRRRLWRAMQWPVALGCVLLALAAVNRRLIEEAPLSVLELLLHDGGLLGPMGPLARFNVSLPQLPRPSLDALIASAGFNVTALIGLTDTLTDTLNDLTDTISAGRLSVTVRGLMSQLPAFSLPPPLGTGTGGANGSSAATAALGVAGLRPGVVMARRGYRAKHPVVIVPGFVTSGLELWQGLPCGQRYFRQRMWGTLAMVQAFLLDPACWFRHMELDPTTGLDPPGIKVRAAVGLEAVDYFIQGYWVWGKLVEALADVGYDSNSLVSMPYDWRLAMPLLEERDGYFTRLRLAIEALTDVNEERVVITAHSYGENVVRSFMSWVEADRPGWVESHVEAVVNIAGTSLGVPKSVSALLSGETRDTAQLGALSGFLTSNLVPRATRTRIWRTWGASYAMLPVGGPRVWGNASWAPDDSREMRTEKRTYGAMISLWPHDWEAVLEAAATAPPQRREELHRLVHDVAQTAESPPPPPPQLPLAKASAESAATVSTEPAAAAAADDADGSNGNGSSSNGNGSSSSGRGNGSSSGSPMARIAGTLMRLVSSGGSDIDPADYLDSDHITRLDVSGFLSLLGEVGGPLVQQHMNEWAAVDLSNASMAATESSESEAENKAESVRHRATAATDSNSPQAQQSLGGPRRLRQSVRRRIALFPDATRTPLPNAPTTAMVCMYGVGLPTERGYHYLRPPPSPQGNAAVPVPVATATAATGSDDNGTTTTGLSTPSDDAMAAVAAAAAAVGSADVDDGGGGGQRSHLPPPPPHDVIASGAESSPESGSDAQGGGGWAILKDVSHRGSSLDVGVQMSDGDGTVPLLSLGLMCRRGWRPGGPLNPAGMRVVTREFKHRSVSMLQDARGGPAAAAHIDILGNEAALQDVIRIAAGRLDELDDVIHSDIDHIAAAVDF